MSKQNKLNPKLWVDNYADSMFTFAASRVSNNDVAEDLVQDTFLAALKASAHFKGDASEKTWLFSILKRKIIDYYRKASSKYEKSFSKISPFESSGEWIGHWKEDRTPDDWDYTEEFNPIEFKKILDQCLGNLPDKYANAFKLKSMKGYESKDICNELNISSSNLWVILHRSRLQLRECLESKWFKKEKL